MSNTGTMVCGLCNGTGEHWSYLHRLPCECPKCGGAGRISNGIAVTEPDEVKRIVWEDRVRQANHLLHEVCTDNYPVTDIDIQVKNEMDQIRRRLDKIAFAIRYPKQAVKNRTLDL